VYEKLISNESLVFLMNDASDSRRIKKSVLFCVVKETEKEREGEREIETS
jgi:hypothetical protein